MKIHELLSENNTETNEALIGKGLGLVGKALKYAGGKLAKEPALAAANKVIAGASEKGLQYGAGAYRVARLGASGMTFLKYLGLASIVHDYYKAVEAGEKEVKAGNWTEEEFQDFRQGEMTKLVLAIGTSTVLFTAIKIFSGFSIFIRVLKLSPSPAIKAFAVALNGIPEAARLAWIGFLVSPKGKEAREAIGDLIGRGIIDNTLGGNGVALVDKVKHYFDPTKPDGEFKSPLDQGPGAKDKETTTVDPEKDTPTPASPATAKQADDSSDYAYDKSKFTRSPSGALIPKITPTN